MIRMNCTFCNKQIVFPDDFTCSKCLKVFCSEHKQLEKHECPVAMPTKYIRKTWLRKYGQNITRGKYIVVCDQCGYISKKYFLIEVANEKRKNHILNHKCDEKKVFLEEKHQSEVGN